MTAKSLVVSSRYTILLCLPLLIIVKTYGQVNYVLNPGLEQYSQCPDNYDQINRALNWSSLDSLLINGFTTDGAPEYLNICGGNNPYAGVPQVPFGFKYPHSGKGMAQVLMYNKSVTFPYQRDYLQGRLYQKLTAGKQYCVSFYVFLEQNSAYAVNHIGAYMDRGQIDTTKQPGQPQTQYMPQVVENSIILDTVNWTKVQGSFTSIGNEQFITIGVFFDNSNMQVFNSNPNSPGNITGYYLVDDVSVIESNTPAYAGGTWYKAKKDSVFIGRNEIVPDCYWYRNGVLIDTVHAGFWVKDTVATTYVVKQSICGNVKYDTAHIFIAHDGVGSVGNESVYRIYPNPATTELTIQAPNNTSTASMVIYDMNGRMVLQSEVDFVNGQSHVPLSLKPGLYVLQIVDEEGRKNIQRLSVL